MSKKIEKDEIDWIPL